MERIARCSCEQLKVYVEGDPFATAACSCTNCQRRTGSAFGVGAYFKSQQVVKAEGEAKVFLDTSESGKEIKRSFCPHCGSTVFWEAEFQPELVGIAVGCFNDQNFPEPTASCWNRSKLHWVTLPDTWLHLEKQELPQ